MTVAAARRVVQDSRTMKKLALAFATLCFAAAPVLACPGHSETTSDEVKTADKDKAKDTDQAKADKAKAAEKAKANEKAAEKPAKPADPKKPDKVSSK